MKLSTFWILPVGIFLLYFTWEIATAIQSSQPQSLATAPNLRPELTKLGSKFYLLTWTDNSVVYVSCYPTVKPSMKPAPIKQTPNRYVITCKNKS